MKFFGATILITVKLSLLACFSLMGLETQAISKFVPCHGKIIEVSETNKSTCDMCVQAEDAWSSDCGTTNSNSDINEVTENLTEIVTENFFTRKVIKADTETLNVYRPPPIVLWRSVQPNTKTTVLVL